MKVEGKVHTMKALESTTLKTWYRSNNVSVEASSQTSQAWVKKENTALEVSRMSPTQRLMAQLNELEQVAYQFHYYVKEIVIWSK